MKLKRMVSAMLPSIIVDAVRARRQEERALADERVARKAAQEAEDAARAELEARERNTASNVISWDEACRRADAGGYATRGLTHFRVARARLHVTDGSLLKASALGLAARLVAKPDLSITDFGGAAGEMGADFLAEFPNAQYRVVENPKLVAQMDREPARPGLSFAIVIPPRCDIFYCSGALQYLANPMEIWARGLGSARHGVVLRRNNFAEDERFDVQTSRLFENGVGALPDGFEDFPVAYPRRTLVEARLIAMAELMGFSLIANLDDCETPGDGRYSRQLVFWRNPPRKFSVAMGIGRMVRRLTAGR